MKQLTLKNLVEFRRKSEVGKKNFIEKIKINKLEVLGEDGGDYWVSGISAVCNAYKFDEIELIGEKISELQRKIKETKYPTSRNMYRRNIEVLENYLTMDHKELRPPGKLLFLKKSTSNSIIVVKKLEILAKPQLIFTIRKKNEEMIGCIWFVASAEGYQPEDLSMYCEIIYKLLEQNYAKTYKLISKYCLVVDLLTKQVINYAEIENRKIRTVLNNTLDEINKLI